PTPHMHPLSLHDALPIFGGRIEWLGKPVIAGLSPAFFIAIAIVVVAQVVLTRTVFGRCMIGIGTNEEAMRLAGVDPRPVKIAVRSEEHTSELQSRGHLVC